MADIKNLTDEQLKQVAGGDDIPEGLKPKYQPGDVVEKDNGWILEIVSVLGYWSGFVYDALILESNHTGGHFCPGKHMNLPEFLIVHKKYGI